MRHLHQNNLRKIRDNDYEFPASVQLSPMAKSTITSLLTTKPGKIIDI